MASAIYPLTMDIKRGLGPLDGVRVLDFTRVLSGPHCTRMLVDLGAHVIKVEPPDGDTTRWTFPKVASIATYFSQQNCGKQNISLDLRRPEAISLLLQLVDQIDVVVENYRPDVMGRLGLGWDELQTRNPRLIYAAISGYGSTGMWANRRAYAPAIAAEMGTLALASDAHHGRVSSDPISHPDLFAGLECFAGILAALYARERTGLGQRVDVSMAETMLKHEFLRFDNDLLIHVHLGLFGKFRVHNTPAVEPHGAVRMRIVGTDTVLDLSGPTACDIGTDDLYDSIAARLGPDPLRKDADVPKFLARVAKSKKSIGQLLMDQAVIAGVGNVYRAEALFVNNIWPERAGNELSDDQRRAVWATTVKMLEAGVKAGRIVTIAKNDPDLPKNSQARDKRTYVYKRDNCLRCGAEIRRWDMAGRWCYACPTCQN